MNDFTRPGWKTKLFFAAKILFSIVLLTFLFSRIPLPQVLA